MPNFNIPGKIALAVVGGVVAGIFVLWLWKRREERRDAILTVMLKAIELGVPASIFDVFGVGKAYVIGNYLGKGSLMWKAVQFVQMMDSPEELAKLFRKLFFNLLKVFVKRDADLTDMLNDVAPNLKRIGYKVVKADGTEWAVPEEPKKPTA